MWTRFNMVSLIGSGLYLLFIGLLNLLNIISASFFKKLLVAYSNSLLFGWSFLGYSLIFYTSSFHIKNTLVIKKKLELVNDYPEKYNTITRLLLSLYFLFQSRTENILRLASCIANISVMLILISPFIQSPQLIESPLPILDNLCFMVGASCYLTSLLLIFIVSILNINLIISNLLITISAIFINFFIAYYHLTIITTKYPIDSMFFYSSLFWAASHSIILGMLNNLSITWIYLLEIAKHHNLNGYIKAFLLVENSDLPYKLIMLGNATMVIASLAGQLLYDLDHPRFTIFYTGYVKIFSNVISLSTMVLIIYKVIKISNPKNLIYLATLSLSISCLLLNLVINYHLQNSVNIISINYYSGIILSISITSVALLYYLNHQHNNPQIRI